MMRSLPMLALPMFSTTAQGWAASFVLHTVVITTAVVVFSDVTLVPVEEPFKWEVSIVEASIAPDKPQAAEASAPPREAPKPPVVAAVEPAVAAEPVMPAPVIEPSREEVQPVAKVPQPVEAPSPVETKPPVAPMPEPVVQQAVFEQTQEPVRPVESQPVETQSPEPVMAKAAPVEPPPARRPVVNAAPPVSQAPAPPAQPVAPITTAKTSTTGVDKPRADYGWLAQSLWKRVVELKRYPHRARLNHWEGKVVLRAVIRHDGHLEDLTLEDSSGYEELDEAAMELVREACPLHMTQPLGRSQVVVQVPITYALR